MKENTLFSLTGLGGSSLGMITQILNVQSLIDAFLFGLLGALGGLVVKLAYNRIKRIGKDSETTAKP